MRIAIFSDPHANLQAIEAVLEDVRERAPDMTVCLGDLVDYGASPNEVVELVRSSADLVLCGNHDLAVIGTIGYTKFRSHAQTAVEWTRSVLSKGSGDYLDTLTPSSELEGAHLFHASARDPVNEYILKADVAEANFAADDAGLMFVGHTHMAGAFRHDGSLNGWPLAPGKLILDEARWILNPGSVGQPRDSDPRASWMLWETEDDWVELIRTPYDIVSAQRAIRAAGLPEALADRLAEGR